LSPIRIIVRMPEPDCFLRYRISAATRNFTSGKSLWLRAVVLKWFYSLIRRETVYRVPVYSSKVKVKVRTLVIVPLTSVRLETSSALQSRKWQLTGMSQWCRSALCGHPLPALTDNWTNGAASRHTIAPISHTRHSPRSRRYYSFPVPLKVGG